MILDKGICTLSRLENAASAGNMPADRLVQIHQSWYAELDFSTDPEYATGHREDVAVSARIRVHQNRAITNLHVAELSAQPGKRYEVTRVYHGVDDESGEPISDLSLKAVET